MAGVDPYALCPCGSGQKFKWCCQKMESYADRAQRLYETGQTSAALDALDEGLRKEPANAWLLTRKALILVREQRSEEAKATLRQLLSRQPQHVGVLALLARCVLETEGPIAGVESLQSAIAQVSTAERGGLASMIAVTGTLLARVGHYQAALAHLGLARSLAARDGGDKRPSSVESSILSNPAILPWVKTQYHLSPAPEGIDPALGTRFAEALAWGEFGLWLSAASAFDLISADLRGPEADRNAGLCRLWLADEAGAVEALRRAVRKLGATEEAVDLEALCQIVEPPRADDKVENVQLIWPLRDRETLLAALRATAEVVEDEPSPIDPADPDSPEVDQFLLLDRPPLAAGDGKRLGLAELPRILGQVSVGREIVALEGHDDGSLDPLAERLTAIAGAAVPKAHPKTKVLGEVSRVQLALSWEWYPPEGIDPAEVRRLTDEQQSALIRDVWPKTSLPYLGGRTPLKAAEAGDAVVPLRAALCQIERQQELSRSPVDLAALRATLKAPAEPEVEPSTFDPEVLPPARYAYVPVDRLDDEDLLDYYEVARTMMLPGPLERAARALAGRQPLIDGGRVAALTVYSELANAAASRDEPAEAMRWVEAGRKAEPPADRPKTAASWDMLEVGLRARSEPPEVWVPELAVVLERYREDAAASQALVLNLLEMGLVRMAPNPDNPQDYLLDPRPLQALMAEFGPRVTTASGQLGVAATKGGLWTPASEAGASPGGIWTPGSAAPAAPGSPDKPKLIIPGR